MHVCTIVCAEAADEKADELVASRGHFGGHFGARGVLSSAPDMKDLDHFTVASVGLRSLFALML